MSDDPPLDLPTRDGYDLWSAGYDADANPVPAVEEPCVDRLLGDVRGLTVLDLAAPLPFAGASFDRVVCGLVVDHIADLDGLFREMRRVCRLGGRVVVT